MAQEYQITAFGQPRKYFDTAFKNQAKTYSFDFSAWAAENHDVTSVAWSVVSGQAAVSGAALAANIASALITYGEPGAQLIKITATTSSEVYVVYLDVTVKDPQSGTSDYGLMV